MLVVKHGPPGSPVTVLGECRLEPAPAPDSIVQVMDPTDARALEETFDPALPSRSRYLSYKTGVIGYFKDGESAPTYETVIEITDEDPTKLPGWAPAVIYSGAAGVVESEASQDATNDNLEKED